MAPTTKSSDAMSSSSSLSLATQQQNQQSSSEQILAERQATESCSPTPGTYECARESPIDSVSSNGSQNNSSCSIAIMNESNKDNQRSDEPKQHGHESEHSTHVVHVGSAAINSSITVRDNTRRAASATLPATCQTPPVTFAEGNKNVTIQQQQQQMVTLEALYDLVGGEKGAKADADGDATSARYEGRAMSPDSRGECCLREPELKSEAGLLYTSRERLRLKDFSSEVRASMDVEQFVHQAELILDMTQVSVEDIVDAMLERVISTDQAPSSRLNEARQVIFTQGSSMLFARTIQGVGSVANANGLQPLKGTTLNYDQSWLCALCNLAQTSRRHMIIARFKQPINMGENAREIRLFMLIVTPSKEKGTKNALDTGRTFATMLNDSCFRQRLLEARSETEFKSLMMLKAQQLSKAKQLKNRHKYMLDAAVHMSISTLGNSNPEFGSNFMGADGGSVPNCLQFTSSRFSSSGRQAHQFTFNRKELDTSLDDGNDTNNNNISICKSNNNNSLANNGSAGSGRRMLFNKNPRASKLFELIAQANEASINNNNFGDSDGDGDGDKRQDSSDGKCASKNRSSITSHGGVCSLIRLLYSNLEFGKGLWGDFKRRLRYYPSDFKDAFIGPPKTIQKTVATIWFLYFGILLPTIAFSALNTTQTHGHMGDLRKAVIGQAIGGLCFAVFGGQPLVIIMTTAPLCLYTKVIHQMCLDYGYHFPAMYAAVGLWNGFFLTIYSLFGFSKLMKWCTRSTEEIFALFIVIAFVTDASKDLMKNFNRYYHTQACTNQTAATLVPAGVSSTPTTSDWLDGTTSEGANLWRSTLAEAPSVPTGLIQAESTVCRRETSLLFILLMLGTLWLATTLYRFNKTRYLEASKRELLADYALPTAVIVMSYVGSYVFDDIFVEKFPPLKDIRFEMARVEHLPLSGILTSLGLGFTLSLLFFMDQNISAAMVNAPQNKLKKGCAYHFDLLVVGILNIFLAFYGLPMMHGVLPHSPLHVRSLADIEGRVEEGHLSEVIVNVRETRVTGIVSHILVLGSLLLIPYPIAYIPTAVLNGLFLYMAITSLDGLQMFERILLLFTEQSKYPPNHYIRRCPQRKIHQFTMFQIIQLSVMCLFGFSPFNIVEMFFPVIILLMIPFRHKVVTKYIDAKYLEALDGKH